MYYNSGQMVRMSPFTSGLQIYCCGAMALKSQSDRTYIHGQRSGIVTLHHVYSNYIVVPLAPTRASARLRVQAVRSSSLSAHGLAA